MTRHLSLTSAIGLLFLAGAASAEVTPQEVWDSWQALLTSAGQELTVGDVADSGDRVEATDVVAAYKDALGGAATVTFDRLVFEDNGDGSVTVTMPESYPVALAFPREGEGPGTAKLTVSQPRMTVVAGGSATETSYAFTLPTATITLDEVTDATGAVLDTEGSITLSGAEASYLVRRVGEETGLDSSFTAATVAVALSGTDSVEGGGTGGQGKLAMALADVSGKTNGNFLKADLMANMAMALKAGFTMDSAFEFGTMTMTFDLVEASGPTAIAANAAGGSFVLAMNKDRLNYGSTLTGAKFTLSGAEIPFPQVELAFAESGFNLDMPVTKSDSPQDFAFLTKLVDFTVSEDIWGLFDPAGTLSREPATVIVDLNGTGFWTQEILDPEVQMEGAEPPGELHSLNLGQVLARAAGAEVAATGGLTFDNTDLATFGGMPRPDGKVTVMIKGVTQLVDNLIALGILSEDDAMGFRMGLAMFARPGAGPDELTSEIEFKDGGLFANGMQMQ